MSKRNNLSIAETGDAAPLLHYEIRVRGRLSEDQWTAWFDDLALTSRRGESILRGSAQDHAALYGLIARLRDLAVPLLAVKVLDGEAQRTLTAQSRRCHLLVNLLLITVYLILLGGLSALTVFLTSDGILHTALALALLFAVVGGLAYAFAMWSGQKAWRWITYLAWPGSMLTFLIYTAVDKILHPAIAIALILFSAAGGIIFVLLALRGKTQSLDENLIAFNLLGERESQPDYADAIERDKPR